MKDSQVFEVTIRGDDQDTQSLESYTEYIIPVKLIIENGISSQLTAPNTNPPVEIVISEDSCSDKTVTELEDPSTIYCFFCEEKFTEKLLLEDHLNYHASDTIFECPDCGDIFAKLPLFIEHINETHNADIDLSRPALAEVDNLKGEDNDSQPDSSFDSAFNDQIADGSESDHWSEEEQKTSYYSKKKNNGKFKCELCDSRFTHKNMLTLHAQKIHFGIKKGEFDDDPKNKVEKYICDYCGSSYYSKYHLRIHLKEHVYPIVCQFCSQRYRDEADLRVHLRNHGSGYSCYECQVFFTDVSRYQNHIKRKHQKKTSFPCEMCSPMKMFKRASDLKKHQYIHLGIKPYKCDCGKSFTHQTSLRHHKLTHNASSEKLFVCSDCGMGFNYAGNLKVHMRRHTGVKPYKCKVCFREFARSANLNEHMHIHLELKTHHCKVCTKSFTSSSALSKHKKFVHLGVRDKVCKVCDKAFVTHAHLASHIRTHSDEREFQCHCGKEFRRIDTLRAHEKTHERENEQVAPSIGYAPPSESTVEPIYMPEDSYSQESIQKEVADEYIAQQEQQQAIQSNYQAQLPLPNPEEVVNDYSVQVLDYTVLHSMTQPVDLPAQHSELPSSHVNIPASHGELPLPPTNELNIPIYDQNYSNSVTHQNVLAPVYYDPAYIPQTGSMTDDGRYLPSYSYSTNSSIPSYSSDPNFTYATDNVYQYQPMPQYHWPQMDPTYSHVANGT